MGRVRSYKKIKAIDPFSKRGKSNDETVHDEPPELFEQREKNSKKRKQHDWDNEEQREILLQREAMRSLKLTAKKETTKEVKKVEGQKEGESLREFKKRVREGMRKTLSEEVGKMTATAKRRKEKLKERKIAKKNKGKPEDYNQEEVMEFSMAADGRLRPSDLGTSSSSFAKKENLSFGERVERPPDLKSFSATLNARKLKSQQLAEARTVGKKQLQRRLTQLAKDSDSGNEEEDGESEEEAVPAPKKAKKQHIMDRLDMEGDDGLEQTALAAKGKIGIIHAGSHSRQTQQSEGSSGKKQPSSMSTKNANFAEMEKIRGRVQAAYKLLRDKRRADNTFNKQSQ